MKTIIIKIKAMLLASKIAYIFLITMLLSNASFSQAHVTMSMRNITATSNTIEYDLFILNDGNTSVKLSACSFGINFNPSILNGGIITCSQLSNTRDADLSNLSKLSMAKKEANDFQQLRLTTIPVKLDQSVELYPKAPYKIGRFRIINSEKWTANSNPSFTLQEQTKIGFTTTQLVAYIGSSKLLTALTPTLTSIKTEVEKSPTLNPDISFINSNANANTNTITAQENSHFQRLRQEGILTVYPNPATSNLHVEINHPYTSKASFKVLDLLGKIISADRIDLVEGNNKINVEVNELNSGIYFVKIQDDEGKQYSQRFTKQ